MMLNPANYTSDWSDIFKIRLYLADEKVRNNLIEDKIIETYEQINEWKRLIINTDSKEVKEFYRRQKIKVSYELYKLLDKAYTEQEDELIKLDISLAKINEDVELPSDESVYSEHNACL